MGMVIEHTGVVERYPGSGGWWFVSMPDELVEPLRRRSERGLIPITATVGSSTWSTSLMPKGDGTLFVPLNSRVRKAAGIDVGDEITIAVAPK